MTFLWTLRTKPCQIAFSIAARNLLKLPETTQKLPTLEEPSWGTAGISQTLQPLTWEHERASMGREFTAALTTTVTRIASRSSNSFSTSPRINSATSKISTRSSFPSEDPSSLASMTTTLRRFRSWIPGAGRTWFRISQALILSTNPSATNLTPLSVLRGSGRESRTQPWARLWIAFGPLTSSGILRLTRTKTGRWSVLTIQRTRVFWRAWLTVICKKGKLRL